MKNKIILLFIILIVGCGESDRERPNYYENDYDWGNKMESMMDILLAGTKGMNKVI